MNDDYTILQDTIEVLIQEMEGYEKRPSKASSKRVRVTAGEVKNLITPARKALLERDKNT